MNIRLGIGVVLALLMGSAIAGTDSYGMTYQVTASSHPVEVAIDSFSIARRVTSDGGSGPSSAANRPTTTPVNAGQLKFSLGRNGATLANAFKKGSTLVKVKVQLSETTPAGTMVVTRTWTLSQVTVNGYSVAGPHLKNTGFATVNISWESIKVS
jgi:hypothetical protein